MDFANNVDIYADNDDLQDVAAAAAIVNGGGGFFLACEDLVEGGGEILTIPSRLCFFLPLPSFFVVVVVVVVFFVKWKSYRVHQFNFLGRDQSTVAQEAETTVTECSMTSCV